MQNLHRFVSEHREELIKVILVDFENAPNSEVIEEININAVFKTIKDEYTSLYKLYKRSLIPNSVDLNHWPKPSSLIIGNELEPLASLFIPLVYAISAGAPTVLKSQNKRLDLLLGQKFSKYLDSSIYLYSRNSKEALSDLDFSQIVREESSSCLNIVALLDTDLSIQRAISEIFKWKALLNGKNSNAPDLVLVHELHLHELLRIAKEFPEIEVKVLEDPFEISTLSQKSLVLHVAKSTTETAILFLLTRKIKNFTYLGNPQFGEYILKFAPTVKKASINAVKIVSYPDLSRATFQDRRFITSANKLTSDLGFGSKPNKFALPELKIKYEKNIGFFEQGLFLSLGFIGLTTISALSYGIFVLRTK